MTMDAMFNTRVSTDNLSTSCHVGTKTISSMICWCMQATDMDSEGTGTADEHWALVAVAVMLVWAAALSKEIGITMVRCRLARMLDWALLVTHDLGPGMELGFIMIDANICTHGRLSTDALTVMLVWAAALCKNLDHHVEWQTSGQPNRTNCHIKHSFGQGLRDIHSVSPGSGCITWRELTYSPRI